MTRDHDRDWIGAQGIANRSTRPPCPQTVRDRTIAGQPAEWHPSRRAKHPSHERRDRTQVGRNRKPLPHTGKIRLQFRAHRLKRPVVAPHFRRSCREPSTILGIVPQPQGDVTQSVVGHPEKHHADRRPEGAEPHWRQLGQAEHGSESVARGRDRLLGHDCRRLCRHLVEHAGDPPDTPPGRLAHRTRLRMTLQPDPARLIDVAGKPRVNGTTEV